MDSRKKLAAIAGLLYLSVVLTGIFHLKYVPSKLIDWHSASITYNNITASKTLFKFGILAGILCYTAFLFLPLVLYKLLRPVNKPYALLMVVLALSSVPISFINLLNKFAVLTLVGNAQYLHVFEVDKLQADVLLHLSYYNNGNQLASVFWGLWLFPFGYLVVKSGFLPKIFGLLLMVGCFGYLIDFTGKFLFPEYKNSMVSDFITIPGSIGEIGICLWFLFIGIKDKPGKSALALTENE